MRRNYWLLFAITLVFAVAGYDLAHAVPASPQPIGATAPAPDIQLVRRVVRGGVVVRGGGWRVGGRYYGGIWYGAGRHFWHGRWWPYGEGSCWRVAPVGYVWICG